MRKGIIILVMLILCAGGAGAGYFYFFKPAQASAGPEADQKAAAEKSHEEAVPSVFVEMDPLILPVMDGESVNQTISLVLALEVADAETAAKVEAMSPKLKDAFIQDMYGALNVHEALKGGVVQIGMIKARLNKITTEVLGQDVVQDVLLQVVQQRPI